VNRQVINAAVLGFVTCELALFAVFFMFDRLSGPAWEMLLIPFMNAALYGVIVFLFGIARQRTATPSLR
jgi:hypothetical protein